MADYTSPNMLRKERPGSRPISGGRGREMSCAQTRSRTRRRSSGAFSSHAASGPQAHTDPKAICICVEVVVFVSKRTHGEMGEGQRRTETKQRRQDCKS